MEIPQFTCYYQQSAMIQNGGSPLKESKTVETQTFSTSKITTAIQLKSRIQRENLQRQINFDFKSLKLNNPIISVRSRLLNDEDNDHNEAENRHLSDIELLRRVYDELRHKISQASQDEKIAKLKINKEISWKECFLGERMRRWSLWFIITFLAAMTIRDITLLVIEYLEYPKQSDMNIMFNESMYMPNITFCMSRQQAWSYLPLNNSELADEWDRRVKGELEKLNSRKKFLHEVWDYRLIAEAYEVIATLNSMERETTAKGSARSINFFRTQPRLRAKRAMVKAWLNEIQHRDVTFEELTQKVGLETIKYSIRRFQRTTFNESMKIKTRFRTSWISTMQFCFQPWFDADNYLEIRDQGNFFTMLLSHNADNLEGLNIACMSVDFHGRPSSLSRFMEGQGRARDGFNDDLCLGIRHEVTVDVRARYVMLENDDNGTACRKAIKQENEFDCRSRCRMEMIRDMCKCTPPTLSYLVKNKNEYNEFPICDYEKCIIDIRNNTYSDQQCTRKCYRSCDQITYEVSHVQHGKTFHRGFTIINLNWGSFEYLTLSQYWVWSMPTFIAALGGSMGAWLGLSILSLIQGSTYLYTFLTATIKKKRLRLKNWSRRNPPTSSTDEIVTCYRKKNEQV
ncbi:Amiloride-sensitive sodium channel family protein [Acanthocheilonema viteae]